MTLGSPNRFRTMGVVVCALALACARPGPAAGQASADPAQTTQLLGKAHALEVRGRMDMAKQTWQQVLLVDPNNVEALAGMARAAKLEGKSDEAATYINKLRAINPNDPNIARVEALSKAQDTSVQLRDAGRLAQAGQYARAMTILRQVYGNEPPPGEPALSYYQTEAATEDGRPHAIAGLRALMDKFPSDSRYQIALGKILTYNPRTRAEGRKLLQRHPADPEATEALRQSLVWDAQNPATSGDIRAYLVKHKDPGLAASLAQNEAAAAASRRAAPRGPAAVPLTPEQQEAQAAQRARGAEEQAAYNALNAKRLEDAEARFKALLAKNPQDAQALAGLGYVRMNQSNFGGAISYLEQAEQDGTRDAGVAKALRDSRFYYTMQEATAALNEGSLTTAEQQFQAALHIRPTDPTALLGLGGTLLKGQQAEAAVSVFSTYVRQSPGDKAAWRGLFMAQYGAQRFSEALATDKRVPPAVKAQLMRDPDYLRTLASVYSALGRDAEAQRVLRSALDLPFPADARGVKSDMQLQYAGLLAAADRKDQAAGLYRQVLSADSSNVGAWQGLIEMQHSLGQDAEAYQSLQSMPPPTYDLAMKESGFETTVAAIFEGQGHYDLAQQVLENFLAQQQQEGQKPFLPAQIQLAGIYLSHGNSAKAYPLYGAILQANPGNTSAWNGLLSTLHATGHDPEALAQLQQMPQPVRRQLENEPSFLQTVGSIYAGLGQPQEAMVFFKRVQAHYASAHVAPPADIDIQEGWLLFNAGNDAGLYQQLMLVGSRQDLTDAQRMTVQTIWASWAVRRANAAIKAGNPKRAIAILNAAARSFPGNPAVIKALASGYASAGLPKQAVAIFKSQDMSAATAGDYKSAVAAALAANDLKDAEIWLRFGLDQYPRDAQMLVLAAKFEQARGDAGRARDYYRASLKAMPPDDPGLELAQELKKPTPVAPARLPSAQQPQDLATLLGQPDTVAGGTGALTPVPQRPYLPSYNGVSGSAPVQLNGPGTGGYTGYTTPSTGKQPRTQKTTTLKDYVPQSRLEGAPLRLHPSREMEAKFGPYVSYDPSAGVPHLADVTHALGDGFAVDAGLEGAAVTMRAARFEPQQSTGTQGTYTAPDGTPVVAYVPNAKSAAKKEITAGTSARARAAAAARANQSPGAMTGQSQPPVETYDTAPSAQMDNAQYSTGPYNPAQVQANQVPSSQVSPPGVKRRTQPRATGQPYSTLPAQAPTTLPPGPGTLPQTNYQPYQPYQPNGYQQGAPQSPLPQNSYQQNLPQTTANPQQVGEGYGQQYPQPNTHPRTTTRRRVRRRTRPATAPAPPQPEQGPPISYPNYQAPLTNVGPPQIATPYPLPTPPSDYELEQRNLPPLRGYYDPRVDEKTPLTERQQTELDLATVEGSYSGWLGGTVIGRYRSGTPGIDRLSSLEIPFEASAVLGNAVRLTVVPRAVFLNSGTLDTTSGALGANPVLGTLTGNVANPPQQQFASGVGGELQLATHTFAAAVGYTPYEFLVSNVIGRVRWQPGGSHFTLYGGRDPVKETQLSYAGLRDPGQATTTFGGPIWGGVVQTGGGIRFDIGDEKSGLYVLGEGAVLTGYHVLDNRKYDGTMGAYFRVANWAQAGSLNVGGTIFGEHYDHNERGETYGLGGYFSPEAYFLAAIPVTFNGHYKQNLHYTINGSVGLQTFQEDNQIFFPLDPAIQNGLTCSLATQSSCEALVNSNTGLNYSVDAEAAYRVNEHWYVGGFLSGNNTNNYNTVSGGFFARYLFRQQVPGVDYPTGLFPSEGLRPLRVP